MLNKITTKLSDIGISTGMTYLQNKLGVSITYNGSTRYLNYAIYHLLKHQPDNLCKCILSGDMSYFSYDKMNMVSEIKRTDKLSKTSITKFINEFSFGMCTDIIMYLGRYTFIRINRKTKTNLAGATTCDDLIISFFGKMAYQQMKLLFRFEREIYNRSACKFSLSNEGVLMLGAYGEFYRSEDSVIVSKDTLEQIYAYLENCLEISDNIFAKTHTTISPGILFYGPPGTGKSSIIEVIASKFSCDIFYLDVADIHKCQQLVSDEIDKSGLTRRKIFVFEDIDVVAENRDTKAITSDDKIKVSKNFNILLQILDGYLSRPNVIKIATTNHIDKIDPAIIRFGRFDLKIKMDDFNRPMAEKMCKNFNVSNEILDMVSFPINPAELQCIILDNYQKYRLDKK